MSRSTASSKNTGNASRGPWTRRSVLPAASGRVRGGASRAAGYGAVPRNQDLRGNLRLAKMFTAVVSRPRRQGRPKVSGPSSTHRETFGRRRWRGRETRAQTRRSQPLRGRETTAVNVFARRESRGLAPRIVRLPATGAGSARPESRGLAPRIVRLLTTAATHPVARTCGGSPCNLRRGRPR